MNSEHQVSFVGAQFWQHVTISQVTVTESPKEAGLSDFFVPTSVRGWIRSVVSVDASAFPYAVCSDYTSASGRVSALLQHARFLRDFDLRTATAAANVPEREF